MNIHKEFTRRKCNPMRKAGFLSRISFFYSIDFLKIYYGKNLDENDLYEVLPDLQSQTLGDKLEEIWKQSKKPKIMNVLSKAFLKTYLNYTFFFSLFYLVRTYLEPVLLTIILKAFKESNESKELKDLKFNYAIGSATILVILYLASNTFINYYFFMLHKIALQIAVGLSSMIYRKILRAKRCDANTTSNVVTLITKDVLMFDNIINFTCDFFSFIIIFIVTTILIYRKVGVVGLTGHVIILITIAVQIILSKKLYHQRLKVAIDTAKRIEIIKETLSAIKAIKMYTWESYFIKKISKARKKEIRGIFILSLIKFIIILLSTICTSANFYIFCIIYMQIYQSISTEDLFYVLLMLNSLRLMFNLFVPTGISGIGEMYSAFKRLQAVFQLEEILDETENSYYCKEITFNNTNLDIAFLSSINFTIQNGGLILVTGPVGSGKSALLKSILGEYPLKGSCIIHGSLSYASQEPWIFPSTIKQNIIFGSEVDMKRYKQVLKICCLDFDLEQFDEADESILLDRGINLSKGQQIRINLARALYRKADIYLLDDPFSALDSNVGMTVFQNCTEFLKNHITIIVTQDLNYLKYENLDKQVLLVQNGKVDLYDDENIEHNSWISDNIDQDVLGNDLNEIIQVAKTDADNKNFETDNLLDVNHQNLYHEDVNIGLVSMSTLKTYCKYSGGYILIFLSILIFSCFGISHELSYKFVSRWVEAEEKLLASKKNQSLLFQLDLNQKNRDYYFFIYNGLFSLSILLGLVRISLHFFMVFRASIKIHETMTNAVINSKMIFFDRHLMGNIINRFSKDIYNVDENVPGYSFQAFMLFSDLVGYLVLVASSNWFLLILITCLAVMYFFFLKYVFLPITCTVKRLESAVHSSMVGYLNSTLDGLETIRVHGTNKLLIEEFDKHQDKFCSAYFSMITLTKFFGVNTENFGVVVLIVIILYIFIMQNMTAYDVGLVIAVFCRVFDLMSFLNRQIIEFLGFMTSVERALNYAAVDIENYSGYEIADWPQEGVINISNISFTYPTNNVMALKNITFEVKDRQKIGIIGRTGSGKSSLLSVLFQFYPYQGQICIDHVDIKYLSLSYRSKIGVIPQDPLVFSGSIRDNLDPYGKFTDNELCISLKNVKLEVDLSENVQDISLSTGQKQLLCLARVLLTNTKLVLLDEATSSLDAQTDFVINEILEENLKDCTVLIITHKLKTLKNVDHILSINNGKILNFT